MQRNRVVYQRGTNPKRALGVCTETETGIGADLLEEVTDVLLGAEKCDPRELTVLSIHPDGDAEVWEEYEPWRNTSVVHPELEGLPEPSDIGGFSKPDLVRLARKLMQIDGVGQLNVRANKEVLAKACVKPIRALKLSLGAETEEPAPAA